MTLLDLRVVLLIRKRQLIFFSWRIVSLWNSVPSDIRSIEPSTGKMVAFNNALLNYYWDNVMLRFNSDNVCTWVSHCRCPACRPV